MGAEESKSSRATRQSQENVSRDEVKKLLEIQKREYEKRLRELQIRTANSTPNSNWPTEVARDVLTRNSEEVLGQQLQQFAQIAYNSAPSTSSGIRYAINPNAQTSTVKPRVEQQTSRFSYTNEDLRKIQSPSQAQNQTLYPKLGNDFVVVDKNTSSISCRNQSLASNLTPPCSPSTSSNLTSPTNPFLSKPSTSRNPSPATKPRPVFTSNISSNNGININSPNSVAFVPTPSTSRVQPSAPPESALKDGPSKPPALKPQGNKKNSDNFNCITCGNKYGLNIFQCSLGHSSCRDCKLRSEPCGICRNPIGDMRNITLEGIVAEAKKKCPNHNEGCNYYCKVVDMDRHLNECPFGEYTCPMQTFFGRCQWKGKLSQMADHFGAVHPENCQASVDTEMYLINVVDDNHNVYFIDMAPFNFLVHVKVDGNERKVFMVVQLLGTRGSASNWTYEFQVYNKREPRRKFVHSDICNSNSVSLIKIFEEMKCATLPLPYALTFINEGSLTYKFFIKKECDDSKVKGRGRGRGRGRGAKGNDAN